MSVPNAPVAMDDVMLAMDVVDTLRHSARVVERELDADGQDRRLLERLKSIYASQGIDVPEHILREGVEALREDRFRYTPTPRTFSRRLAEFYVRKKHIKWKKVMIVGLVAYAASFLLYNTLWITPDVREKQHYVELVQTLPQDIRALQDRVYTLSGNPQIQEEANILAKSALSALYVKDMQGALADKERLENMTKLLAKDYNLRIVSGPGEDSGVWRVPEDQPNARNYYLIVEPVGPNGQVVRLDITNEENNKVVNTQKFGVRVSEKVFNDVRADKEEDGIIQNNIVGTKKRGELDVEYNIPVMSGRITDW